MATSDNDEGDLWTTSHEEGVGSTGGATKASKEEALCAIVNGLKEMVLMLTKNETKATKALTARLKDGVGAVSKRSKWFK